MHASLAELLESLKTGLLWVTRDATVRYANGLGITRTGLSPGRKLWDPELVRAVTAVVGAGSPRVVQAIGVSQGGGPAPSLSCRVIPGLSRDDAFILIQSDGSEDGTAIDNLMQVIRCDLRDPLRHAHAALEAPGAQPVDPALQPARDSLRELLGALDTLLDLAGVWRSGALLANDRIELWPLLQRVWSDVEPLAQAQRVKVRFRAQVEAEDLATLYGSEPWLGRVLRECLEAAIRSSRPNTTLHIEHRQLGPRALIVFRDSGVFGAHDAGTVPMTGAPRGTTPRLPARDQVGLELCRHVLTMHGGQLREESEDGLRNFLIELPTGAPFRPDQAAIDVAQVQQYARDLAELMSRARHRPAAAPSPQASPTAGAFGA